MKDICRELAADFANRTAEHDQDHSAPTENVDMMREAGLFGVAVSKELGGLGVGMVGWGAAAEEIAQD